MKHDEGFNIALQMETIAERSSDSAAGLADVIKSRVRFRRALQIPGKGTIVMCPIQLAIYKGDLAETKSLVEDRGACECEPD